jgi:hypothetical protein
MKVNVPATEKADILPVLITPSTTVKEGAVAHLGGVSLWNLGDFRKWAKEALVTIRELRTSFTEPGDLAWRDEAATKLKEKGFDAASLMALLRKSKASDLLKSVR